MIIPTVNADHVTPHAEAFQAVVWHLLGHPSAAQGGGDEMGIGPVTRRARRAVFLDRDGVLNRAIVKDGKPYPPQSLDELEIPADAPDGARRRCGRPGSSWSA